MLTGNASAACSMRAMYHGPGVQVVAWSARGRTGAAADHCRHAGNQRPLRLLWADPVNMCIHAACGDDLAFPAMTSVPTPIGIVTLG